MPINQPTLLIKESKILKKGGVGIIPTDTIYGLVGRALNKETVARIYRLKKRDAKKPFIILIGSIRDLKKFDIKISPEISKIIKKCWPGKTSVIFPCPAAKFKYLHRGRKSLAFRLPKEKKLIRLLKITGPLVAPSANIENHPPAKTIKEAENYFNDKVDFYADAGRLNRKPSKLIKIKKDEILIIR